MKRDALWGLLFVGMLALIWGIAFGSPTVTYQDHLQDLRGNSLGKYWVGFYRVVGADTTLVAVDTTSRAEGYTVSVPAGAYFVYVAKNGVGATDTVYEKTAIVPWDAKEALDTLAITDLLTVTGPATFGEAVQVDSTLSVGNIDVDTTGYDVNFYGAEAGDRMFWDESKAAFRAGKATGTEWDSDSTGEYSFVCGENSKAMGKNSISFGYNCEARGVRSFAGGSESIASGTKSFAWGCDSQARGTSSMAFGFSDAGGMYSIAMGQSMTDAHAGIALGSACTTQGIGAIAIGNQIAAREDRSMGLGKWLTADSVSAMVIGCGQDANNRLVNNITNSIMFGINDTVPTMTIVDDTVTVDNTLIAPEIIGNLTGTVDSAIVANRAYTAVKFDVSDTAKFGGHVRMDSTLHVIGDVALDDSLRTQKFTVNLDAYFGTKLYHLADANTYIEYTTDQIDFWAGGHHMLKLDETTYGGVFVNESGHNQDFRVEGNTDENLIFADGSDDRVYIGADSGSAKLSVVGNIKADTVKAAVQGNVVGDLTGTADSAIVAADWTAKDSKADTNSAMYYQYISAFASRDLVDDLDLGDSAHTTFAFSDTVMLVECRFLLKGWTGGSYFSLEKVLANDTIFVSDSLSASAWYDTTVALSDTLYPDDGLLVGFEKVSGLTWRHMTNIQLKILELNP